MKGIILLLGILLLSGCGLWGAKDYNRVSTLLLIEGTDCKVTFSDGKVYGGPGVSSRKDDIDLHQGVTPR